MSVSRGLFALLAAFGLWLHAATAAETTTTLIRVSNPPGLGRITFDLPVNASAETITEGDKVRVAFHGAGRLRRFGPTLRNVVTLDVDEAGVTLVMVPGARLRPGQFGRRHILDVLDPPAAANPRSPGARAAQLAPSLPDGARGLGKAEPARSAGNEPDAVAATTPELLQPGEPTARSTSPTPEADRPELPGEPQAEPVRRNDPVVVKHPASFVIPADVTVGAAAFRRDQTAVIVLDRRLSFEPPPGQETVITPGPVATVIYVPLPSELALALTRTPSGWSVDTVEAGSPANMALTSGSEEVSFALPHPGRVVSVLDPTTGTALLVGTSLGAGATAALGPARRTPEYLLLPTWQGVVVEPVSDSVDLHRTTAGFTLRGAQTTLKPVVTETASKRFDFPNEPVANLLNRLDAQLASAAAAPPRGRSLAREGAAQAMLALGMGAEAQALIQTVIDQDPQAAADAQVTAIAAVAAVAAGRLDEAAALDDPRLGEADEVVLWRGVRDRRLGRDTAASAKLPSLAAVALAYPKPLRRLIWPDVAEASVTANVSLPADQLTPFASALQLERAGDVDKAIAAWQSLSNGADQYDRVRAAVRGAELRLAAGRINAGEAADIIDRQTVAWRGDGREVELRLRAAELRAAAGKWRQALELLRETETLFPDQARAVRPRKTAVFEQMLSAEGGTLAPLDLVLLTSDYADCIPEGTPGGTLAALLADKLLALDLPARAIPVLQGLVRATPAGPARAELGARLGQVLLEGGDAAAARSALLASAAPDLAAPLAETRAVLIARTMAAQGDVAGAIASLQSLGTAQADDERATLLAGTGQWQASLNALSDLAAKLVPPTGALSDEAQAIVLRQAQAAARVPNPAALQDLSREVARLDPTRSDQLRILTQAPITSTRDLPRSAKELQLARTFSNRS